MDRADEKGQTASDDQLQKTQKRRAVGIDDEVDDRLHDRQREHERRTRAVHRVVHRVRYPRVGGDSHVPRHARSGRRGLLSRLAAREEVVFRAGDGIVSGVGRK